MVIYYSVLDTLKKMDEVVGKKLGFAILKSHSELNFL